MRMWMCVSVCACLRLSVSMEVVDIFVSRKAGVELAGKTAPGAEIKPEMLRRAWVRV